MGPETGQNNDIFISCRKGDLERVRYLTEEKEINLNVRDKWDSTPLYYACLCGHAEVVSYLLENGARCDASTFDEFLRRLLEEGLNSDLTFNVNGTNIKAHRFILAARSSYFEEQLLGGRWQNRELVTINNVLVDGTVFHRMIEWLYTGQVKLMIGQIDDALRLCKQCRLLEFEEEIHAAFTKADSFVSTKRGTKIRHVQIESKQSETDLQEDFAILAMLTLPYEFQFRWHYWMELPMKPKAPGCDQFADIIFKVQSHLFHCHRAMFCTRSNYFQALINDHFNEGSWDDNLQIPVIEIHNIDASVFAVIVNHVYSNMQNISPEMFMILWKCQICSFYQILNGKWDHTL